MVHILRFGISPENQESLNKTCYSPFHEYALSNLCSQSSLSILDNRDNPINQNQSINTLIIISQEKEEKNSTYGCSNPPSVLPILSPSSQPIIFNNLCPILPSPILSAPCPTRSPSLCRALASGAPNFFAPRGLSFCPPPPPPRE
ncbi:hypothetical protein BCR39DRAFT_523979 [Naematelia encephala]|uniref:Uncharacterized protein n=1 Tax=Naematelia encephala TaxID=71784 RepID=A0A1Y2BBW8_9TREE|nr:hypothetical protein BCR39DRAFT_523979 [Naematelia encephala]